MDISLMRAILSTTGDAYVTPHMLQSLDRKDSLSTKEKAAAQTYTKRSASTCIIDDSKANQVEKVRHYLNVFKENGYRSFVCLTMLV